MFDAGGIRIGYMLRSASMLIIAPRSVMCQFVVVPVVTVSYCLFRGILSLCVNVSILLQLFFLVLPSAWHLSIVIDGCASSDWLPGPMLVCVRLGDVCIVIGSSLMFLVFFYLCFDKKSWSYLFYHNRYGAILTGNWLKLGLRVNVNICKISATCENSHKPRNGTITNILVG